MSLAGLGRANLHTDRIDKQNQTKLLDKSDDRRVDLHSETAQRNTHKENPRNTERDSGDFDFAQCNTDRDCYCEREYSMGDAATEKQR